MRIDDGVDVVERSVVSYGGVQAGYLEKGCSWITLFIAMAPSLGFLGTVIGMVQAYSITTSFLKMKLRQALWKILLLI